VTFPIWRKLSAELSGRYESYNPTSKFEADFAISQSAFTLNFAPWLSLGAMYEYSDEVGSPFVIPDRHHFVAGQVIYRFMPGSWVKLFFGQTRGGLKCAGGVCRVFPAFSGLRGELTVRF